MASVVEIRGKTEQRVSAIIDCLKEARNPLNYEELSNETGTAYDVLLYILATLVEVGLVQRHEVPSPGPGRPKVQFTWIAAKGRARAVGAR